MKKSFRRALAKILTVVMVITAIPLSGITDKKQNVPLSVGASAYDLEESEVWSPDRELSENGGVWFGPKSFRVDTFPGEDFTFTVEFKANLSENTLAEYDREGTLVIPFWITANDVFATPLKSVELTNEAKAAGIRLTDNYKEFVGYPDDYIVTPEEASQDYMGQVIMPASFLFSKEGIDLLNITATLDENIEWPIDEYGNSENPQDIGVYVGSCMGYPVELIDSEGNEISIDTIMEYQSGFELVQINNGGLHGKCGDSAAWDIDPDTGVLTISGTGDIYDFSSYFPPFYHSSLIKSAVIESGITKIGNCLFSECTGLTSVTISDSVTSIGKSAFKKCQNLTSVTIGNGVTSIGMSAFEECEKLTDITIGSSVTSIGESAFAFCFGLTSVTIPDSVTSIGETAFALCYGLTSVTIPDSTTSIGDYAFWGCLGLTSVTIPDSVTSIGEDAFYRVANIMYNGTAEGSPWGARNINGYAEDGLVYSDSTKRTLVACPAFKTGTVTIPDGVTSIGDEAFYNCTKLTSITIPDSVTNIGKRVFDDCNNLTDIYYSGSPEQWDTLKEEINIPSVATVHYYWNCKHTFEVVDYITEPDCTHDGMANYRCTRCGETKTDVAPKHSATTRHMVIPATCTQQGNEYDICTACYIMQNYQVIPALGHTWSEWIVESEATCTDNGITYRTCSTCENREEIITEASGHSYVDAVTAPTCEEQGYTTHTCSTCGDFVIDSYVPATGHKYEWVVSVNPTTTSTGVMENKCEYCGTVVNTMTIPRLLPDSVEKITLSSEKEAIALGESVTITATVLPETAKNKNVVWKSSDTSVATVLDGVVTAVKPGVTVITAQAEGTGYKDYCLVRVIGLRAVNVNTVIDGENGLVYGFELNSTDVTEYVDVVDDSMSIECGDTVICTGSQINIVCDGEIVDTYEAVLFGDVNHDGWYDGADSIIVNCLANGILSREQVGEAAYMAADCNHDGVIDAADVALLEQAGLILANVDQSRNPTELFEDAAFCEYISLIDQNPTEGTPVEEAPTDVTPTDEPIDEGFNKSFVERLIDFIIFIVNLMKSFIAKF